MDNTVEDNNLWWEKTVEWRFVQLMCNSTVHAKGFPLDGDYEKALGDCLVKCKGFVSLIEFKRDKSSASSEKIKYLVDRKSDAAKRDEEFEKVKNNLSGLDAAAKHFLIYGATTSVDGGKFDLILDKYWSAVSGEFSGQILESTIKLAGNGETDSEPTLFALKYYFLALAFSRHVEIEDESGGDSSALCIRVETEGGGYFGSISKNHRKSNWKVLC